jgi:TonB family protein
MATRSWRDALTGIQPHSASVLVHAGIVAGLVLVTPLAAEDRPEVLAVEIIETAQHPASLVQPEPEPEPEPPPRMEPSRPRVVPNHACMKLVKRARPHHPNAAVLNELERSTSSPDAEPSLEPSEPAPLFEIPMEATVHGGDGIEVLAVERGSGNVLADPRRPGVRGGRGSGKPTQAPNVELAESWEITAEPVPRNDHELEPVYPPEARARGLEAVVAVALIIDAKGRVVKARLVRSGGPGFDRSALAYCRQLRFRPAEANGVPVASRIVWEVYYRFHNR